VPWGTNGLGVFMIYLALQRIILRLLFFGCAGVFPQKTSAQSLKSNY
jgi:hypothetical protein